MFAFNVMEGRQNVNMFCYLCYIKILILSKNVHPKFTLKWECGAAEEAGVVGCLPCGGNEGTQVAVCKGAFVFAVWAAVDEGTWKGWCMGWEDTSRQFFSTSMSSNLDMLA